MTPIEKLQERVSILETEESELKEEVQDLEFDLSIVKSVLTGSLKTINTLMFEPSDEELNNALEFLNTVSRNCEYIYDGAFGPTKKSKTIR